MATVNPIQIRRFLKRVNYPAGKGDLIKHAVQEGTDEQVRSTLERLPDQQFQTPADVSEARGKIE